MKCCQPEANHVLECKDSYGDGWHGGYIQIGDEPKKWCEDFTTGTKKTVDVENKGTECWDLCGKKTGMVTIKF